MKKYRYSPRPMEDYLLRTVECEVSIIKKSEHADALWNLMWLSIPDIDAVPGAGKNWWRVYRPWVGAQAAMIADVSDDEVLRRKLTMHPSAFITWFEREDHSIYDCFEAMDRKDWVNTVLSRAAAAESRILLEEPAAWVSDNVVHVNFRRAA